MTNNLPFVNKIIQRLTKSGISTILFGGWAQELTRMISPKSHKDIDLLFINKDFRLVDKFINENSDILEITTKRYLHKRAFMLDGVMIEIILIQQEKKEFVSWFWGEYKLTWPAIKPICYTTDTKQIVRVASPDVLRFYTDNYQNINKLRQKILRAA
ncbi:hypothetical protein [Mucilaginibacter ginsenosidivorans]|uniref:Nucleotidyltransferase family protein n=1 Tax=Mucilaginibacter ginsenosidivorans TaxID=398053 RepID=A0A5B8UU53_9SPHI|nr:hypothetical protein [Mucilaginibacter ginsenosidivorans]QEC62429.1 hypothetical protein FRZ54_07460 [Mucilaginibacter ginsenosidivorans]